MFLSSFMCCSRLYHWLLIKYEFCYSLLYLDPEMKLTFLPALSLQSVLSPGVHNTRGSTCILLQSAYLVCQIFGFLLSFRHCVFQCCLVFPVWDLFFWSQGEKKSILLFQDHLFLMIVTFLCKNNNLKNMFIMPFYDSFVSWKML